MLKIKINGKTVELEPQMGLYKQKEIAGHEMPGIAISLYSLDKMGNKVAFPGLTVNFGFYIGLRNAAYIDTNNCNFAKQILKQGIAKDTGFSRVSGFCRYPLWVFDEDFLKSCSNNGEYEEYIKKFEEYSESPYLDIPDNDFETVMM